MPWRSSVPPMASTMPISPARMPWRAVAGELIHFSERMNNALAMRYWLPANSVILWLCRTAGLEHPQHAVGDEKSANYVARRSDDGNHPQNGRECALLFADQDNRTDDRDGIEGIRQRHEWRMQQRRNVADNFESDESRQHEYEKCIDQ